MLLKIIFALCLLEVSLALPKKERGFDYCNNAKTRCSEGDNHTGCNSPYWKGGFGTKCKDATLINMSKQLKPKIVNVHNKNRNRQALGSVSPHYLPAKVMATMVWDQNLANMAELHARNCIFEHDQCRNTKKWWLSGQSIYLESSTEKWDTTDKIEQQILNMTGQWFESEWPNGEYYNWMDAIYDNYTTNPEQANHVIGHWTVYVQDINQAVGCAAVQYQEKSGWWSIFYVCNYAFTNLEGRSAYIPGKAASGCKKRNPKLKGLCANGQKYYLDKNTSYP